MLGEVVRRSFPPVLKRPGDAVTFVGPVKHQMERRKASLYLSLLVGTLVLVISLIGFFNLRGRPEIPWSVLARTTGIPSKYLPGAVLRIDDFEILEPDFDFNFIEARHRIGDPVDFVFAKDGREQVVRERLVPYYANGAFPVIFLLTGVLSFIIGFGVFVLRTEDERARVFFWLCTVFSSAVLINGEWYGVQGRTSYLVIGALFLFGYALTPAFLLRFVLTLTSRGKVRWFSAVWGASLLFGGTFSAAFISSFLLPSIGINRINKYFVLFRLYFVALCVTAVVILIRSYRASASRERKNQIKWVFLGLAMGLGPFMLLYQLPRGFDLSPILGEEVASAFFVLLPFALAVTILKYKLMDVDLIIKRSIVYSFLTMITAGVYLASIEGLKRLFTQSSPLGRGWVPVGAAVIAAVVFAPARNKIQVLVDKAFYRREYSYRKAVLGFNAAAGKANGAGELLDLFENALAESLPVEKIGALILEPCDGPLGIALRRGLNDAAVSLLALQPGSDNAWTKGKSIEVLKKTDSTMGGIFADLGFEIVQPLPLGKGFPPGWIFVGSKKSGLKFTEEDQELIETLGVETAEALRRIRLQKEIVNERASREKSEELSRLKTEFISTVSHELRTPMTSLQGISQLLQSGKVADESRRERLLELMANECVRLGRFLNNVLDFGRIEQNAMSYVFRETDLKPLVADAAEIIRSAMGGEDLDLVIDMQEGRFCVDADADAVRRALLNLADNAIKYGFVRKRVALRLARNDGHIEVSVSDNGIGIPAGDREKIFGAFFRSPAAVRHDPKGVGLGLKIVKHIMDAHGGTIGIESEPGQGTTFTLKFPERRKP